MPPHWLTAVTAPLADPAVGLVTCLYRGEAADGGLWSRLAALGIDWQFLPNACLGESLGRAYGCYGATMALRAETLARIGGFQALAGLLADDHALGAAVRRLGLRVVVAPVLPAHRMTEPGPLALLRHELRWARTLRLLDPGGYAGMGITYPLVPGLLAAALLPGAGWPWPSRGGPGARCAQRGPGAAPGRDLAPILRFCRCATLISFAIWGAGLARGTVTWQGPAVPHAARWQHGGRQKQRLIFTNDAHPVPPGSFLRRLRWRRRLALPGEAGDQALLVPDLAGPAGGAGPEGSKLIDAPPHRHGLADVVPMARDHDLVVLHTSTPSFASDVKVAEALKAANPAIKVGLIGAKVAVQAEESLRDAPVVDFVARNEFDFTVKEVADGRDWRQIKGLSYRNGDGAHRPQPRTGAMLEDMDSLPFVTAGLQARPRRSRTTSSAT